MIYGAGSVCWSGGGGWITNKLSWSTHVFLVNDRFKVTFSSISKTICTSDLSSNYIIFGLQDNTSPSKKVY